MTNFKGFQSFSASFRGDAVLIGPNNAGKTTLIAALKIANLAARTAMRQKPNFVANDGKRDVMAHRIQRADVVGVLEENVRHEFREEPTSISLKFDGQATAHVIWPVGEEAFAWIEHPTNQWVTSAKRAKELLHSATFVPTLAPVEHQEKRLTNTYLRENIETRLFSRHFRNQIAMIKDQNSQEYEELMEYLLDRTPELSALELRETYEDATYLDLMYRDVMSRAEKEIVWAGDGLQIWLQFLFHMWRSGDAPTVILDEPDVFLHPDLQRRLVREIEASNAQVILATHAPEIAGESKLGSVMWIDRQDRRAKAVTDDVVLGQLSSTLGSGFNLAIARALRSKVALFVEGKDMKLLRLLARVAGASRFVREEGLTVVPIGGFSKWPSVEAFAWMKQEFLGSTVELRILLDRDYRTNEECQAVIDKLTEHDVSAHIWHRKELESYLLEVPPISRITGATPADIECMLARLVDQQQLQVQSQFVSHAVSSKAKSEDLSTATQRGLEAFNQQWTSVASRVALVNAKDVISGLNQQLAASGKRTLTARRLAEVITMNELDYEMVQQLLAIDEALST